MMNVLPFYRFSPLRVEGCAVPGLVEQTFTCKADDPVGGGGS